MHKTLLFLMLALCTGGPLSGQIVRIQSDATARDTSRWHGHVELNVQSSRSSESFFRLAVGSRVVHQTGRITLLSMNELRQIIAGDDDFENKGFQHLRFQYRLDSTFTIEYFSQVQFDQVLKIRLRALNGSGPRVRFLRSTKTSLYLGILYMYEYEEENETGWISRDHRLSNYLSVSRTFSRFGFQFIVFYQPLIRDFHDFRLSGSGGVSVNITSRLTISARFEYTHDTAPVAGVPDRTHDLLTGLRWIF